MHNIKYKIISQLSEIFLLPKNHSKGLTIYGDPNSIKPHYDDNGNIDQIRIYGSSGFAYCDYDFDDHNKPKYHPFHKHNGAHKHYYSLENNKVKHSEPKELTDYEYNTYIKPYLNK